MPPASPYHPVLLLPAGAPVLDLRAGYGEPAPGAPPSPWSIGRYDEDRGVYTTALFTAGPAPRTVHMGIDLGGPVGEPVHAFGDGEVLFAGVNPAPGDYGAVIVLAHTFEGRPLYALYGHLSHASLRQSPVGRCVRGGDTLGWLGDPDENGGWPPHVHLQLSWARPATHDLPGAVSRADREEALRLYPDPRLVLGALY
jgi:murein DD-endopeptidase MepM/ murein hydrolase activator NlpD